MFTSPYNLKWHPHAGFKSKCNGTRFQKALFLMMPSKATKLLPITCAILSFKTRTQPYYLANTMFITHSVKLYLKRVNTNNYKERLFRKQKGICFYCNKVLISVDKKNFFSDIFGYALEVYYKDKLVETQKIYKFVCKASHFFNNLVLLHKTCYFEVISKLDFGKPSAERLAR